MEAIFSAIQAFILWLGVVFQKGLDAFWSWLYWIGDSIIIGFKELFSLLTWFFQTVYSVITSLIPTVAQAVYDLTFNFAYWLQSRAVPVAKSIIDYLPDPPITFGTVLTAVDNAFPDFLSPFAPHFAVLSAVVGVRVTQATVKLIKGWL